MKRNLSIPAAMLVLAPSIVANAQSGPAIRQIGALEHVTPDSFALQSITAALSMPSGRVMINDTRGRRVLLFDSTMSRAMSPADTTGATADAYGASWATLIRFRADTALLMVPSTLSMFVIGPTGATARVMAIPSPNDAQSLAGTWGVPGFDAKGRLVYFGGHGVLMGVLMLGRGMALLQDGKPTQLTRILEQNSGGTFHIGVTRMDSSVITRIDLTSRAIDTVAWVRIPRFQREIKLDENGLVVSISTTPDPLPLIDQWTVLRDGTIAIVRGRDYHVDWIDASGHMSSTPKMPFDWQRVRDSQKEALIDSAVKQWQGEFDRIAADRLNSGGNGRGSSSGASGGRGGSGGGGAGRGGPTELAPMIAARASLGDVPDYQPPFTEHAVTSDEDGNLWIRTTRVANNRPVYDVVNRRGEAIDRVQLPSFRALAGFGPGVVYMSFVDASGKAHLERARLR